MKEMSRCKIFYLPIADPRPVSFLWNGTLKPRDQVQLLYGVSRTSPLLYCCFWDLQWHTGSLDVTERIQTQEMFISRQMMGQLQQD